MKKFLIRSLGFILILILTVELFYGKSPSIFNLRSFIGFSKNMLLESKKDTLPLNPDGEVIRLRKNNIGYHSHSDFYLENNTQNYAIIGDSFVNSTVCGTYNSIAYLLDEKLENSTVFNFGKAGGNIHDYYEIYDEYNLKSLKKVFILLTGTNDLMYFKKSVDFKKTESKFINLLQTKINGPKLYDSPNYDLIRKDTKNIVYILHDNITKSTLISNGITHDMIEINIHKSQRFSDGHYKREGNKIIADKMVGYLNQTP